MGTEIDRLDRATGQVGAMALHPWRWVAGAAALAIAAGSLAFMTAPGDSDTARRDPPRTPAVVVPRTAPPEPRPGLLIADLDHKRLLVTDLRGRVIWKFRNPLGDTDGTSGPIGVRWRGQGKIIATFGTGDVGQIDAATKTFDWRVEGFGDDYFTSPYDAQLLPRGKLAVATRYDEGGRVAVYDRSSGRRVWRHLISNAHAVTYRPPRLSYRTKFPTLIVGGYGAIRELTYRPGRTPRKVWGVSADDTHGVLPMPDGTLLSAEDVLIRRVKRSGDERWRRSTPGLAKRITRLPDGVFAVTIAEDDRVELRNSRGRLLRSFRKLSDGTRLDYPYGIRTVDLTVVCELPNARQRYC
jgi:hypothetical protein